MEELIRQISAILSLVAMGLCFYGGRMSDLKAYLKSFAVRVSFKGEGIQFVHAKDHESAVREVREYFRIDGLIVDSIDFEIDGVSGVERRGAK